MNIPKIGPLRKGQLITNFLWWLANTKEYNAYFLSQSGSKYADIFYMQDDELEKYFQEYLNELSK